jgi:hypothetical protein
MSSSGEQPICDGSDILSPTLAYSRSLPHGLNGMMPTSCMLPGNGKSLEGMMLGEYMVHNSWQEMCQQIPFNSNYSSPDQGWHTVGTFWRRRRVPENQKKLSGWEKRWNSQPSNLAWLSLVMHDPVNLLLLLKWTRPCESKPGDIGAAPQGKCYMIAVAVWWCQSELLQHDTELLRGFIPVSIMCCSINCYKFYWIVSQSVCLTLWSQYGHPCNHHPIARDFAWHCQRGVHTQSLAHHKGWMMGGQ